MGGKTREKKIFKINTNRCSKKWRKSSQKSAKKYFLINTWILWPKMEGKKSTKNFYQKHTYIASKKDGKKSSGKSAKARFLYKHTNIVTKKWGKKNAKIFFSRNTRISRVINDGKKSSGKSAKKCFLINTWILWPKMGEKNEKKILPETNVYREQKTEKNRLEKVRKHVFL